MSDLLGAFRAAIVIRLTSGSPISKTTAENALDELLSHQRAAIADALRAERKAHSDPKTRAAYYRAAQIAETHGERT